MNGTQMWDATFDTGEFYAIPNRLLKQKPELKAELFFHKQPTHKHLEVPKYTVFFIKTEDYDRIINSHGVKVDAHWHMVTQSGIYFYKVKVKRVSGNVSSRELDKKDWERGFRHKYFNGGR